MSNPYRTEWLTVAAAARIAGVSVDTIRRWTDENRIESIRTAGGHRRIDAASIDRVMLSQDATERDIPPTVAVPQFATDAEGWFGWEAPARWSVAESDRFLNHLEDATAAIETLRRAVHAHLDDIGG